MTTDAKTPKDSRLNLTDLLSGRVEACERCRFFEPFKSDKNGDGAGTCRRHPPQLSNAMLHALALYQRDDHDVLDVCDVWETMLDQQNDQTNWQWPVVSHCSDDWCGEFQAR